MITRSGELVRREGRFSEPSATILFQTITTDNGEATWAELKLNLDDEGAWKFHIHSHITAKVANFRFSFDLFSPSGLVLLTLAVTSIQQQDNKDKIYEPSGNERFLRYDWSRWNRVLLRYAATFDVS